MEHKNENKIAEIAHTEHSKSDNSNTTNAVITTNPNAKTSNSHVDTYSYKGWLNSDKFLKRALANVGYNVVGGLIIYAIIFVPIMLIMLLVGIFAAIIGTGN
jgi:hypothetical protein